MRRGAYYARLGCIALRCLRPVANLFGECAEQRLKVVGEVDTVTWGAGALRVQLAGCRQGVAPPQMAHRQSVDDAGGRPKQTRHRLIIRESWRGFRS